MADNRVDDIRESIANGSPYDTPPQSRVEYLLLQIKNQGGGGGTTDYNQLTNKPSINGQELVGDMTSQDLGLGEWEDV